MNAYKDIKKKELETTKGYSDKKLDRYIWICKAIRHVYGERLFWTASVIPILAFFLLDPATSIIGIVAHFIYWRFRGSKDACQMVDETLPMLNMSIEALEEIRKERPKI